MGILSVGGQRPVEMVNRKRNTRSSGYKSTRKYAKTKNDDEPAKKAAKEEEVSDTEEYEVERILGKRNNKGTEEFLIKWKNYSYTENTWEPMEHLDGCDAAMDAFKNGPKAIRTIPVKPATEDNDDSS